MNRKAIIFGIKKTKLTKEESSFFTKVKPWGIILFSRNIKDLQQLKILINEIKTLFEDKKFPILIDQEGGKVSRLNDIVDLELDRNHPQKNQPNMDVLGSLRNY